MVGDPGVVPFFSFTPNLDCSSLLISLPRPSSIWTNVSVVGGSVAVLLAGVDTLFFDYGINFGDWTLVVLDALLSFAFPKTPGTRLLKFGGGGLAGFGF